MKTCKKCAVEKDESCFSKCRSNKDGLRGACKECANAKNRKWHEENRERVNAKNRKWHEENRERVNATRSKWHEENRERSHTTNKKWKEENRERSKAINCVAHALSRTNLVPEVFFGGHTRREACGFTLPFIEERLRLEEETGRPHHIDHIKPLCDGGLHIPENLQVLCAKENLTKGPIWFEEELTDEEIEELDAETLAFNPIS